MASLQEIKTRLNSVTTTKKITKAMQLVATAKLKRAKNNLENIQEFSASVCGVFDELIGSLDKDSLIGPKNPEKSTIYVLITSDVGLCGSYNSSVIKMAKAKMTGNDKLIIIGAKGNSAFKNNKRVISYIEHVGDAPDYVAASDIAKSIIGTYLAGKTDKIELIYTKFINSVSFEATSLQVLPLEVTSETKKDTSTEFEPNAQTVVKNALPLYVSSIIYSSLIESKVSEMSSRRMAMESATDNAQELIDDLNLKYNRARQAEITQEISEIIAGSEVR